MDYKEELQSLGCECPPAESSLPSKHRLYRLVQDHPPTEDDFKSGWALGKKKPENIDLCRWASCSLFVSIDKIEVIRKLPKFRDHNAIVAVNLDQTSGRILTSSNGHVDWWPYKSFEVLQNCELQVKFV